MEFKKGMNVCYHGDCGVIDFVDEFYIVIQIPQHIENLNNPRLCVPPWFYGKVVVNETEAPKLP